MPTYTSALTYYKKQKAAFETVPRSAKQAWRQIPEGGYRDFKELTSGSISSATLGKMGHPYARQGKGRRGTSKAYQKANGRGSAPLLPVNRQSSRLHNSVTLWHRSTAYTLEESVGFDSAKAGRSIYAVQPQGTAYVVPRGVWGEVRTRGRARSRAYNDVFYKDQRQAFARP